MKELKENYHDLLCITSMGSMSSTVHSDTTDLSVV